MWLLLFREIRECLKLDPDHKDCFPVYKVQISSFCVFECYFLSGLKCRFEWIVVNSIPFAINVLQTSFEECLQLLRNFFGREGWERFSKIAKSVGRGGGWVGRCVHLSKCVTTFLFRKEIFEWYYFAENEETK